MNFDEAFGRLLGHEGGYSDNPADPGGETMYGITARVARRHGYQGAMRDLPLTLAKQIARAEYWDAVRADELPDAVRSAAWYWFRNHCGIPAARGNIDAVTRIINGSAMAGKQDRRDLFARAMSLLCPSAPSTT